MKNFKYLIKIEKNYKEGADFYVEGIASGLELDAYGTKMSLEALNDFVNALPLPLTNNHNNGDVTEEMGQVVEAWIENNSLYIKAKLDMDNPNCQFLVKQLEKGKKYAFSIEAYVKDGHEETEDGEPIYVYDKVEPIAISVTTQPAYTSSFLEVMSRSLDKEILDKIRKNKSMKKKIKKSEDVNGELVQAPVEQEVAATEPQVETVESNVETETVDDSKSSTEVVDNPSEEVSQLEMEEKPAEETTDNGATEINQAVESLKSMVTELQSQVDQLKANNGIEGKVEDTQAYNSPVIEALAQLRDMNKQYRSLTKEVEKLKDLPLMKKSKSLKPKVKKAKKPEVETIYDIAKKSFNIR